MKIILNRVKLVEGRFPEKPGECLAERSSLATESIPIGTTVRLVIWHRWNILENLEHNEYTVVGLVENPPLYCLW